MSFRRSLVKVVAVLSLFLTGTSLINVPNVNQTQTVQAASTKEKRNAVVKLANKQVGKRYVYGATGPFSFDCSGLAQYVYKRAAKKTLPRTTFGQVTKGKRVSMNHLKKGDLLFWGSAASPYHVGIYVGGGKYVHAATPSQGVRKQALSGYFYPSAAKRVLN
ncbi:C40 family peptidase [Lactobacillus kefiranofaciens]|uniref:C40 family peptidase n=1 Tax=Lactobacillus kefiranofaciens TaxID=267818 RepID=A0AAX3UCR2_9LACO|nr:C40 family peptidase [Lactobacillus kefiranofaciens]AEG41100.1 Hypothetical protein WANG_1405 [Lactobacillus kefiranofaciens subsp. kefiranofaciens]KRM21328.1 hypothetical protein FC93_GL000984 [Lactobacillus kefiranofaciens subsp. kefiranofaciens DSM 5016 = JCM 6985]MCJ2172257.1 C40 family peptidase [Lactobacillus kefiranofaciens]MCP9330581.1 C40 family peptidase [Lactobacillus kefiranofaciens]MDF4142692.1 C40 family peptidase [Lactobacillus kefiranofaciens]